MTTTIDAPAVDAEVEPAADEVSLDGQRDTASGEVTKVTGRHVTVAIPYNVRDSYGTSWAPGFAKDSLTSGQVIPVVLNHDDSKIVGRVEGFRDTPSHLELDLLLADPERVPDAAVVQSLLGDRMIEGVSFRFREGVATRDPKNKGTALVRSARIGHVSFVVDASIPGARVVGVRSAADIAGVAALCESNVIDSVEARTLLGFDGPAPAQRAAAGDELVTVTEDGLRCARATDAALMSALTALADVDVDTLPDGVREAVGLVVAAGVASEGLREALGLPDPEVGDRASGKPYGDVTYADPGYQDDGKHRYPLDTEDHVRAAWSYINQEANAAKYSADDLAKVRAAIKKAAGDLGINISDDEGTRSADVDEIDSLAVGALATLNARRGGADPKA